MSADFENKEKVKEKSVNEWWIDNLLPKAKLTLLSAEGGTGKTSLAGYLAMRLADRARVAYWSFEDDPQDFKNKDVDHYNIEFIHTKNEEPFTGSKEDFTSLWNFLYDGGFDILIIDPIAQLASGDTNDNQKVRALLAPFNEMCEGLQLTVLGIHHFRKPGKGGGSIKHNATGAAAWVNTARHCLSLVRNDFGDLLLEVAKSNIARTGTAWEVQTAVDEYAFKVTGITRTDDGAAQTALEDPSKKRIPPVILALKEEFNIGRPFNLDDVDSVGNRKSFYNYMDRNPNEFQECLHKKDGKKAWIFV